MKDLYRENGIIESTLLGWEDHGIFTCSLSIHFDSSGQGFGGAILDAPNRDGAGTFKGRVGTAFGMDFIMGICRALGVDSWEKLKGSHCRVERADSYGPIKRIGHIIKDQWFDPEALADQHGLRSAGNAS